MDLKEERCGLPILASLWIARRRVVCPLLSIITPMARKRSALRDQFGHSGFSIHDRDDDEFESAPPKYQSRGPYETYWDSEPTNEEIRSEWELNPPRRGRARSYGEDPVNNIRMCQTEVALRLGRHLAQSPLLKGDVYACSSAELSSRAAATMRSSQ